MRIFRKITPVIQATPLMLFLTMALPQAVLMLLRAGTLYFIGDALQTNQALVYTHYLLLPLLLLLLAGVLILWSRRGAGDLPQLCMLGVLLLQSASLVWFFMQLNQLIPARIMGRADGWIVPEGPFIMAQLACAMPGIFYCFLCGANIRLFEQWWMSVAGSFGILVFVPTVIFTAALVTSRWIPSAFAVVPIVVGGTLVAAFAFLQLLLWLFKRVQHNWVLMLICGLLLPLCGLALNIAIPFPADLQHWGIYLLTLINALILLASYHPEFSRHPALGVSLALCYPFSCYFFFLFLPFLPFSLLAMMAVGSGFLILAPTALFVMHTIQLRAAFKRTAASYGKALAGVAFAAAFLVVPVLYVGRAYVHKVVFLKTLDAVYAQSFQQPVDLPSPAVGRYVIKKMRDAKEGFYVPILSEVYNSIVFGGMVLPDAKMEQLSKLLLGRDYEQQSGLADLSFYSMFTNESRRRSGRNITAPSRRVELINAAVSNSAASAGAIEASLMLTMRNRGERQAEFKTTIEVPPGVFISGYELKIGDELVPARLSDRRAAMWVYHMIRDRERRDPGLLVYTAPGRLGLNVFPFAAQEERVCLIRFLYPQGARPTVRVGERSVTLPGGPQATTRITTSAGHQALYIPAGYLGGEQSVQRARERVVLTGSAATAGYCPEWDLKRALLRYLASGEEQFTHVPLFVTGSDQQSVELDGAAWWLPQIPDSGWVKTNGAALPPELAVIPFKCGSEIRVVLAQIGGVVLFSSTAAIERFDGRRSALLPFKAEAVIQPESRYARAVELWQGWWQTQLDLGCEQAMREPLLTTARELNVLIPSAAFLAVESQAQSKALTAAEKKSLREHSTLAFDEFDEENLIDSPEPGVWLLVLLAFPVVIWRQRRGQVP
ncbi:MAG: MSEP-CTERM sorting domain-containing protein [Kiritimatiellae bacterium]|nr:MSEP-CTERM sorting domain-containing protein [Kiritimatiellia bacterium]